MPCRAAPPPPPPPHSTLDLSPSPASLSNPLVYRLRTCCLQEFLPKVSIVQKKSSTRPYCSCFSSSSFHRHNCDNSSTSHSSSSAIPSSRHSRSVATQLSLLLNDGSTNASTILSASSAYHISDDSSLLDSQESTPSSLSTILSRWQPPASSIPLTQLQPALAHRLLKWALSKDLVKLPMKKEQGPEGAKDTDVDTAIDQTLGDNQAQQQSTSLAVAGQGYATAHDLVWPEGDYFMAKKTFIREGVAHLKRGRRYIFVEPVLGPATSYLYPKWTDIATEGPVDDAHDAASVDDQSLYERGARSEYNASINTQGNDAALEQEREQYEDEQQQQQQQHKNDDVQDVHDENLSSSSTEERQQEEGGDKETDNGKMDDETEDRAQSRLADKGVLPCDNIERIEKEETDDIRGDSNPTTTASAVASSTTNNALDNANNTTGSSTSTSTSTSTNANSTNSNPSSPYDDDTHHRHHHQLLHPFESLEPYSPLLDPSTDGQDQFEYGLYELQYIPNIHHLLPHQFLPTRESFIVHLDEDRPTLASPVPIHSKRSECRCQLMMRKVLMQRDLLQVWPPVPPVRTLQERQQEAEEEAHMMKIKQKVQMQTKNWRETLHTQVVACG
ncbi:hypothetical protein BX616_005102 [Lobosporangium transversale]|uniref:Uncharacterized protein n=1 Tax=Lobosporangium transversale TaxID=64571 RepID=A0A1Y2H118_9FUNG|nr:hypothetical protein BCR41DRAFT_367285 [Lobosporangium transversale]KAF9897718.1 hypothetical protein BX616_005102 [Lobosporangium transversale]ORZ27691.1 hypothetical protein BCR41DRAFT_367285 [Lobosporangium transversale]|eukprot:XP_021885394.1 hypothetical protein BCR41DRAFT_367285 [Lobosporangium transversale]